VSDKFKKLSELENKYQEWFDYAYGVLIPISSDMDIDYYRHAFYSGSVAHEEIAQELGNKILDAHKEG
jgi:hypothetical protein